MEPCYGNKFKYHFRITTILKYYFFVFCIYSSYIYFGCCVKMVFNVEVVFKFVASEWIHMFLLMGQPSGARGHEVLNRSAHSFQFQSGAWLVIKMSISWGMDKGHTSMALVFFSHYVVISLEILPYPRGDSGCDASGKDKFSNQSDQLVLCRLVN